MYSCSSSALTSSGPVTAASWASGRRPQASAPSSAPTAHTPNTIPSTREDPDAAIRPGPNPHRSPERKQARAATQSRTADGWQLPDVTMAPLPGYGAAMAATYEAVGVDTEGVDAGLRRLAEWVNA